MGTIVISHNGNIVVIDDCLYIPGCMTLISASQLTRKGLRLLLYNTGACLYKSQRDVREDKPFIKSDKKVSDKLWTLPIKAMAPYTADTPERTEKSKSSFAGFMDSVFAKESAATAHESHAHASLPTLKLLYPHFANIDSLPVCDGCLSQSARKSYAKKYKADYLIHKKDRTTYKLVPAPDSVTTPSQSQIAEPFNALSNPLTDDPPPQEQPNRPNTNSSRPKECKIDDPNLILMTNAVSPGSNIEVLTFDLNSTTEEANAGIEDAPVTHRFGRSLHSDTKYVNTESVRGYRYLFVVVDKDTRVTFGFLGVSKSDFESIAKHWLRKFYNIYQRYPEWWKFDQGGEFLNGELADELKRRSISFVFSTTNAHNQNAYSERKIGVIWNATLKTLASSAVPMQFWCYCAIYMIFVQNHLPHRGIGNDVPLVRANMTKHYNHIHPFGCEVWFVVEPETGSSESRCRRGVFLGVSDIKLGYDILDIESRKVIQSRNVYFVDSRKPFLIAQKPCKIHLDFGTWPSPDATARVSLPDVPIEVKLAADRDYEERGDVQVLPTMSDVPRIQGPSAPNSSDPPLPQTPARRLSPILEATPEPTNVTDWDSGDFELSPEPWEKRTPVLPDFETVPDHKHIDTDDGSPVETVSDHKHIDTKDGPSVETATESEIDLNDLSEEPIATSEPPLPSSIDNPISIFNGNRPSGGAESTTTPNDTVREVTINHAPDDSLEPIVLAKGSLKPLNLAPKQKTAKTSVKITKSKTAGGKGAGKETYLFDLHHRHPNPIRFEPPIEPTVEQQYEIDRIIERRDNEGMKGSDKHSYLVKWADSNGINYPDPVWIYGSSLDDATRRWYNRTYHPPKPKVLRPSKTPVVSDRRRTDSSYNLRNQTVKSMNERDMAGRYEYANATRTNKGDSHCYFGKIPRSSDDDDRIRAENHFSEWNRPIARIDKSSVDAPDPIAPIEKGLHTAFETIAEINSSVHRDHEASKVPKSNVIFRSSNVTIKDVTDSERALSEAALRVSKVNATQSLFDAQPPSDGSALEDVLFTRDYVNNSFETSAAPKLYDGEQPEPPPHLRVKKDRYSETDGNQERSHRDPIPLPPRHKIIPISNDDVTLEQLAQMAERNFTNELEELKIEACNTLGEVSKEELTMEPAASQSKAYSGPYRDEYIEAEHRELKGLHLHGTFEEVYCPPNRTPITCRWAYDLKRDKEGRINLFKARLVVHGFKQVAGVDFNKTFSSTAQLRTFRFVVSIAVAKGYQMNQYDISQAFLNGKLEEEIYMHFPPGYPSKNAGTVLKLIKGLYGLKQASRLWQKTLYKALGDLGLVQCKTESGVLKWAGKDKLCLVVCWVDDLIIVCEDEKLRKQIEDKLTKEFLVKMIGELELYVGIVLEKEKNGDVTLHQGPYNRKVCAKFEVDRQFHANIPAQSDRLSKTDCPLTENEIAESSSYPYLSVTGSLLYSAICTRPDIFYAVMQLARFNSNPGKAHIRASEQCLRYLEETSDMGIKFTAPKDKKAKIKIIAFVDSDWGGCPDTRRSTSGYIIQVCGGPVSWKSRLMPTIALSSCEAEFMALTEVCRELMWMCRFMDEIGVDYEVPEIYCDSSSAINWAEDPVQHQRNKHVEIKYLYCRDIVGDEKVRLFKIHTSHNIADIMTKPVGRQIMDVQRPVAMGHKPPVFD